MTSFLHSKDKNFELDYIKKIYRISPFYFFIFSIFALYNNAYYSFLINLLLGCMFIFTYIFVKLRLFNTCMSLIFISLLVYSGSSVYFFGFGLGFEYFILPIIAYCYLLDFEKQFFTIAIGCVGLLYFYLLIYLFFINDYSLHIPLSVFSFDMSLSLKVFQIVFIGCIFITSSYTIRRIRKEEIKTKQYLHTELDKSVNLDYLTSLKNRWYFIDAVEEMKSKSNVNLAIIDIDYFKTINDIYGHNLGDEVLKNCSKLLIKYFSPYTDLICRWGGEEFLVFVSDLKQIDFLKVCENFRREYEKSVYSNPKIQSTVSIGALYIENNFASNILDEYIKQADICLYSAKNNGRNKIVKNSI